MSWFKLLSLGCRLARSGFNDVSSNDLSVTDRRKDSENSTEYKNLNQTESIFTHRAPLV